MSKINEDQIRDRLEALSKTEPSRGASDRAVQKVRDLLTAGEARRVGPSPPINVGGASPTLRLARFAAAAVLMIGLGYLGGRLSAPAPIDAGQLCADIESSLRDSLEPAIRQELLKEMDARWNSAFAARSAELKGEFQQKIRRDLMEFAEQTLSYTDDRMDRRLAEFARVIHAARVQDRQRTAEGFRYLESNIGSGLVTLAARTNELLNTKQN
ncbi:MAG: hypothetical protein JSW59_02375 [Phycisphaerales bacterium]|nr:MAG: hypothetical protein JSW59_02375 [Phycisphaerales bacterium]